MLLAHHQVLMGGLTQPVLPSGATLWINGTKPSLLYQTSGGSLVSADGQTVGVAQSDDGITRGAPLLGGTPIYKTGIVNGYSVLRFDGSDDYFGVSNTAPPGTTGTSVTAVTLLPASAHTMICAARVVSADASQSLVYNNDALFSDSGGYVGLHVSQSGGTLTYYAYNWDGNADTATVTSPANTWVVISTRHDSGNIRIRLNGGSWVSTASGNTAAAYVTGTNPLIGRNYPTSNRFVPFDLAHLVLANVAWTDGEIATIENYFKTQLGIA